MEHGGIGIQATDSEHNANLLAAAVDNQRIDHAIVIAARGTLLAPQIAMVQQAANNAPVVQRPAPDQRFVPGKYISVIPNYLSHN
jgi:hypothetical protein